MVLVDTFLTIPFILITMDMYCIFSKNCRFCEKIETMNFSRVLFWWLGLCVCACVRRAQKLVTKNIYIFIVFQSYNTTGGPVQK
jgi:hypothetical protein